MTWENIIHSGNLSGSVSPVKLKVRDSLFRLGSRSVRTIEKASGRPAGSAASGIREWKGEGVSPSFSTRLRSSPARIFNRPQWQRARNRLNTWDHWKTTRLIPQIDKTRQDKIYFYSAQFYTTFRLKLQRQLNTVQLRNKRKKMWQ